MKRWLGPKVESPNTRKRRPIRDDGSSDSSLQTMLDSMVSQSLASFGGGAHTHSFFVGALSRGDSWPANVLLAPTIDVTSADVVVVDILTDDDKKLIQTSTKMERSQAARRPDLQVICSSRPSCLSDFERSVTAMMIVMDTP